jgi:hypothetical protein
MEGDYNGTASPAHNHKMFYLFGNGTYNGYSEMPQSMPVINPGAAEQWAFYNNAGDVLYGAGTTYGQTKQVWNRWEYWLQLNSPYTSANGVVQMSVDGTSIVNSSSYLLRKNDGTWKDFRLGHMTNNFSATAKAWFDDLYIATTRARVEIGNASTFSACTHREIQIPTSWSDGTISVTVNQGGFAANSSAYLFVVDSSGNISNGKQITFGSGDTTSLTSPQNLKLTQIVQ